MKNRRIVGVITVRGGWAVQSFGYSRYLPLGRPAVIAENFDRWGADEIYLCCLDRHGKGPDMALLDEIAKLGLTTPLLYAGGILSVDDAISVVSAGADRVVVDAGWLARPDGVREIFNGIGAQGTIASIPVELGAEGGLRMIDYRSGATRELVPELVNAIAAGEVSEVMLVDHRNEGTDRPFDVELLDAFPDAAEKIIAFGGISTPEIARQIFANPRVSAIGIGNFLSYREHAIQYFKDALNDLDVRAAQYYPFRWERLIHAPDL